MTDVVIENVNEIYIRCICADPSNAYNLRDHFTFTIPNAHFAIRNMRKRGIPFDGKIRLYNVLTGYIFRGLLNEVIKYCEENNLTYKHNITPEFYAASVHTPFTEEKARKFIEALNLPIEIEVRDLQLKGFVAAINDHRNLFISPTGSGKSLLIYLIARYLNLKTLILVTTTNLIHQMEGHFRSYGYKDNIHKIYSGQEKVTDDLITVSTWQSLYDMPAKYFDQYNVIFGDEAHHFDAKSLQRIMIKAKNTHYRYGVTATLKDAKTHELTLQGLFGRKVELEKTANMIDQKVLSDLDINVIVLNYPQEIRKQVSKYDYKQEADFIVGHEQRNKFIKNLALSLKGTTLINFRHIEKHGDVLEALFKNNNKKKVFYIHGGVSGEERNDLRKIIETEENAVVLGSTVMVTGADIYNIHNIILGAPIKSSIKLKQLIGRGLRRDENKQHCTFYDIVDNFTYNKKRNYFIKQYIDRIKLYNEEKFKYKIHNIDFK